MTEPATQKDPRRHGKLHYHEDEVRPLKTDRIVHQDPTGDLYHSPERGHPGRDVDLPVRSMQLHVARLDPGHATRLHKHHNEAVIYIIDGTGHSDVQGERYEWHKGDFIYIPTMAWHTHVNSGTEPVFYLGITNKRMLDWLGLDRRVEAGIHMSEDAVREEIDKHEYSPYSYYNIDPGTGVRFGPPGFISHAD
jgi:quercetin dioxygenase-like cupin family protein